MPVPSSINDLSTVAGSNSPLGSETPGQGDDHIRALASFVAQLRDSLAALEIAGASYTPTITNEVGATGSTVLNATYLRVKSVVQVAVQFSIQADASNSAVVIDFTLPITSDLPVGGGSCTGVGCHVGGSFVYTVGQVIGDGANNRASYQFKSLDTVSNLHVVTFQYLIA